MNAAVWSMQANRQASRPGDAFILEEQPEGVYYRKG
jgi:hypothetical protein